MAGDGRHNPLTSEAEAFRWLVVIAAGAATVVAVALLLRPLIGAIWALALIGAGIVYLWRDARQARSQTDLVTRGGDGRYRVLLLANQTVRSSALREAAVEATAGRRSEILLVVPALVSFRGGFRSAQLDAATEHARQRMELTLIDLKEHVRSARGRFEDTAPNQALRNALADFPADEIIVSTLPRDRSHWLEQGVVERARMELDIPVRHLIGSEEGERLEPGDS